MTIAEQIFQQASKLPEPMAKEVLDFIGYLATKQAANDDGIALLRAAQEPVLARIWDNEADEIWNDL